MSKLEDFEDLPYEEEYKKTESKFDIMMKYTLDKIQSLEEEKKFYKQIIKVLLQNKE